MVAAIAASGAFHFLSPVLAEGTAAGTNIINRATASYGDGTNTFDAISNEVRIVVEEVRGLTITDAGFTDDNGGSIATNDELYFDFLITNTGNASAYVYVPGATALDGLAVGGDINAADATSVQIIEFNGAAITPINVPAGGSSTQALATAQFSGGVLSADQSIKVRVKMDVTATNAGDPVKVQFGTTADNTPNTENQQNIAYSTDTGSNTSDVYTIDADAVLSPINGEREAAASHEEFLSSAAAKPLAQVTLLMTSTTAQGANVSSAQDDTITYDLDFRVENNSQPGFPAGSLEGTTIQLNTGSGVAPAQRILVATTVPPNTVWDGNTPTAPAGWTPVYSTDDAYAGTENPVNNVTWTTVAPAPGTVKRIGFIYNSAAPNGALPPGTTVNDFKFTVITSGLPATGGTVANIGQIFGETFGDPGNKLVYDESGDQDPNNYDDGIFPPNPDVSDFVANPKTGAADPGDPDTNGNNSGTGPDGESNVATITTLPPAPGALLNGPNGVPNATGPTNANDDFTNAAATVPTADVGIQGDPSNPNSITFTNTVRNTIATNLDTVTLIPYAPDAAKALTVGIHGVDRDSDNSLNDEIPDGTVVTITFGAQTAIYTYDETLGFTGSSTPVVIGTLTPGQQQNYSVTVDLPGGTPQLLGYTIPILAFVDNNGNGDFNDTTETVYNFTNDRVYPGFINVTKAARVLDRDGTTQLFPAAGYAESFGANERPQPGQFIEYQISYQNISEVQPASGGGNVLLTANNLVINEDGVENLPANPNNWAPVTTHRQNTAASRGTLQFYNGAVLLGASDPASGSAVTRYVNTIPSLAPQVSGTFTFRRIVD
ncbi:hypothetical protein C7271_06740 [filamentous cyanobacterium CCP5]|nr:hypothetical protein C7271_06740 [filamentous cyanobacterium CCP5]